MHVKFAFIYIIETTEAPVMSKTLLEAPERTRESSKGVT